MTTTWSTREVSRLAGVSSRTLRHYDHIGLLRPTGTGAGGTRYYDRQQLLRLQHILVLRELGLGLPEIAEVLDGGTDVVETLHRHHRRLLAEAERLKTLAATVARTIAEHEGGIPVGATEMFDGFAGDPYAEEAVDRWGERARRAQQHAATWSGGEKQDFLDELREVNELLAGYLRGGAGPSEPQVQEAVTRHYKWVCRTWTPDRAAYVGLGRMYVEDERFTQNLDRVEPGLAAFLRDAIEVWAPAHLN
ncbi:DNA-binding transcriptional regulator, MerR family [Pseudonocardia thermophila]|jgi:Predicted transcriptional regulators|uniref:DNA-binding transcriptional regulator, MerR family n=1 Tax=Pseudonocardia thermophila TaxID=1848 RepID=A0A1M6XUQ6_PSETH|nr:MerR family transcriptional regulator [Pseudonocardia thermophila]SHL09760.1 DNA-binding transcriptional regulator, MerR family [Pseudonocardia thermophila]